ncbi:TPA: hypothetical protein ACP7Q5_004790 [Escherichia coli]|nr:hypothetical protein [Salmonella enterica]
MSLNVIDNSITSGTGTFTWTGSSAPAGFGQPLTKSGFMHLWVIDDNANTTTVRHNGNIVSENTKNGGSGYGRRHHDFVAFNAGDTVQWITSLRSGAGVNITQVLFN